jgi:hypothetical protein
MGQFLAAAGTQNVGPQLGAAEAQQTGIGTAGAGFSLAKSRPEGNHRIVPTAAGFTGIGGSRVRDRMRFHGAVLPMQTGHP